MGLGRYLRNSLWDILLCVAASSSLCYACLIAFLATHPFQSMPWLIIGSCAVIELVLFVIAYNFRSAVIGSGLFVVAVGAISIAAWSTSSAPGLFDDVVGNNALLVFMIVLCAVAVFALSRRKIPCLVLLVLGLILCAAIEYLYWDGQVIATALFALATACLYAYRNYQQKLMGSDSEEISFGATTLAAGLTGLLSILLAVGVFMLFIAPLQPPSLTVKLLTKHVRLDEEHVVGTGDEVSVINEMLFSWNVKDETPLQDTSDGKEPDSDDRDNQGGETDQDTAGSSLNIDGTGVDLASAVRIRVPDWLPIAMPFIVVLLIALVIAVRKLLRRRRCNRIRALPGDERVKQFYLMFIRAFGKMKMATPHSQTLREYATNAAGEIARFEGTVEEPAFASLTESYCRIVYGDGYPDDEEVAAFDEYYKTFYRNARKFVGVVKYLPLFFRI